MTAHRPSGDAYNSILQDGFHTIQDALIGDSISAVQQSGSQFHMESDAGVDFCVKHVLQDKRIYSVFKALSGSYILGFYQRIAQDQGHVFQMRRGGTNRDILLVQLFGRGSRIAYYRGSHLLPLTSVRAANRLWEVPLATLNRAECKADEVSFENGGITILDARLAFEMRKGSPITCAFAEAREIETWPKIKIPKAAHAAHLIAQVTDQEIKVHYETQDAISPHQISAAE